MMIFLAAFFSFSTAFAQPLMDSLMEILQYPEERNYTEGDKGMMPYRALSLYNTNTFTLTFDDGPDPIKTPRLLDILKKHEVRATFFVLTNKINQSSFPILKRMLDEGHIVASHGPNHDRSTVLAETVWKNQVKASLESLAFWHRQAGHEFTQIFYRFPYGAYGMQNGYHHMNALRELSREMMGDNCIQFAFWDVDTADWVPGMTPQEISQNIIAHNQGGTAISFKPVKKPNGQTIYRKYPYQIKNPPAGGVVLQHDVHEASVLATDHFLTYARRAGVKIVRLDEVEEFRVLRECRL